MGLQGMIDPPRPEAIAAVRVCQAAGIRVKMITGDHAITAAAIARQIGLIGETGESGQPLALNGRDIAALTDTELIAAVERSAESSHRADNPWMDSFHIERAMINLIDNSGDASQRGKRVTITVVADRNEIGITIKDQGAGMDRETLANLFMPFYTTKNEGTGLGMPISRKVIKAHAGMLGIISRQGVGTEAAIRLPYINRQERKR